MGETSVDQGVDAYRRVLFAPGVTALFASATLAAMPATMGAIALVLFVEHVTGTFAAAGIVTGAFTVGLGSTGPLIARMVDRFGTIVVVVPAALAEAAALVLLVVLGNAGAGTVLLAVVAGIAGAVAPPVGGILRQALPDRLPAADLPTAYALSSVQLELIFIAGPLLAGILAATLGPGACLLVAAPLAVVGGVWLAILVGDRGGPDPGPRRGAAGALASPAIRLLALTAVPLGATFGVLDVAFPAFGAVHGEPSIGGFLTATLAVGSAIGGLVHGARSGRSVSTPHAFLILSVAQALTCLPLLVAWSVPVMFPLALVAAVCVAPLSTVRSQMVQEQALPGTEVESFEWMGLALTLGASAGAAIAGPLIAATDWRAGIGAACAFPVLALVLVLAGRRLLEPAPEVPISVPSA